MDDPDWRDGYAQIEGHGLSFDLQAPWWHLEQAFDLATDFPQTSLILNHTGLPSDRSAEGLRAWRQALEKLARAPNTALKISGLGQRGVRWTAGDNVPLMQEAIAVFGVDRCMFAATSRWTALWAATRRSLTVSVRPSRTGPPPNAAPYCTRMPFEFTGFRVATRQSNRPERPEQPPAGPNP